MRPAEGELPASARCSKRLSGLTRGSTVCPDLGSLRADLTLCVQRCATFNEQRKWGRWLAGKCAHASAAHPVVSSLVVMVLCYLCPRHVMSCRHAQAK